MIDEMRNPFSEKNMCIFFLFFSLEDQQDNMDRGKGFEKNIAHLSQQKNQKGKQETDEARGNI